MKAFFEQARRWQRVRAESGVGDAELLRRFIAGRDEAAFELLVFRHGGMVLGLCRKLLRDDQEAEDAFQATFLVLACRARSVAKRGCLGSWLYKVAYRLALRQQAKRARLPQFVAAPAEQPMPGAADPLVAAERREAGWMLAEEIERLSERLRRAVVLCCLEGKSSSEAARELGCSVKTVATRLMRARTRLRRRLEGRGLAWPAGGLAAACGVSSASAQGLAAIAPPLAAQAVLVFHNGLGQAALSGAVLALAKGAMVAMAWNKAKLGLVCLVAVGLSGWASWQAGAQSGVGLRRGGSPGDGFITVQGRELADDKELILLQRGYQRQAALDGQWAQAVQGFPMALPDTAAQTYPNDPHLPAEAKSWIGDQRKIEDDIREEAEQRIREKRAVLHRKLKRLFDDIRRDGELDQAVALRDQLRRLETSIADAQPNPGALTQFPGRVGQSYTFTVVGAANGTIWGNDLYTDDSPIAVAAVHAGLLKPGERGLIKVTLRSGRDSYEGTERNGVTSQSYRQFNRSYSLERAKLDKDDERPSKERLSR